MIVVAVLMTFFLAIVACRAAGESDITPVGAMGKITQLVFGGIDPGNVTTNLMAASVTAGAATHTADLLTDLKSGYLLGGNPRRQTIAQLCGSVAGMLCCVPVYQVIARSGQTGNVNAPQLHFEIRKGASPLDPTRFLNGA